MTSMREAAVSLSRVAASDIGIEGELWVWLCNCSRHPLIIFSSLPNGVPKGTWLLNCLAHYKMIKNALPPDPAEAMVLDPTCGSSSPVVPHIKLRGYAPELYCLGEHLLPCKKFTPYCFLQHGIHMSGILYPVTITTQSLGHKVTTKRCLCVIDCCTCRLLVPLPITLPVYFCDVCVSAWI